jgi:hypothetical protein
LDLIFQNIFRRFRLTSPPLQGGERYGESKRGGAWKYAHREFKRDKVPLLNSSPFPLLRGRGIKGDGVIHNYWGIFWVSNISAGGKLYSNMLEGIRYLQMNFGGR